MSHTGYLDIVIDVTRIWNHLHWGVDEQAEIGDEGRMNLERKKVAGQALKLMTQHCDRWRSMWIGEESDLIIETLTILPRAPNLTFLHIDGPEDSEIFYWTGDTCPEYIFPSLKELVFTYITLRYLPRIQSSKLVTLRLLDVKMTTLDLTNYATDFPNIETLVLGAMRHNNPSWSVLIFGDPEDFPKLRSLQVPNFPLLAKYQSILPFIKHFAQSPGLKSLWYPTALTDTTVLNKTAAENLTELFLFPEYQAVDAVSPAQDLIDTLKRTPNLRRLGLHPVWSLKKMLLDRTNSAVSKTFTALSRPEDKLCLKLEWMEISRAELTSEDALRFAQTRCGNGDFASCLLNTKQCPPIPDIENATLRDLSAALRINEPEEFRIKEFKLHSELYPDYSSDQSSPYYRRRPHY